LLSLYKLICFVSIEAEYNERMRGQKRFNVLKNAS